MEKKFHFITLTFLVGDVAWPQTWCGQKSLPSWQTWLGHRHVVAKQVKEGDGYLINITSCVATEKKSLYFSHFLGSNCCLATDL